MVGHANVTLDPGAYGFIGGLNADRTVPGLNETGTDGVSDVWPHARKALKDAGNWTCAEFQPPTLGDPCSAGMASPIPADCTAPTGKVCQYNLKAKRVNHYADAMDVVWFDEADRVDPAPQSLPTVALGAITLGAPQLSRGGLSMCVDPSQNNDKPRISPDVITTSGF